MATTASLPITVWRNDDVYELPLRVRGLDLTTVALAMQIRMHGDASGPALIDLAKVTNGNAEGLRVAGVVMENGLPVSDVRIRINKSSRQALPYMGEAGDACRLEYALLIGGRTRLIGPVILPAHAFGSDAAPASRPASWGRAANDELPIAGATLTIAADQRVELVIDGAGETGALIEAGRAAAAEAQGWAEGENLASGRSARAWSREAERQAGASSVAAAIAAGFVGGVLYPTIAAGLAAAPPDGFFAVRGENAAIYARLYKKVNGQAVEQTYLAGGLGLAMVGQRADKGRTFDVTDYGAVGDGVTNDSPAFKLANRMCALAGGGTVFVPKTSAFYLMGDPYRVVGTVGGGPNDPPFNRGIISLLPGVSWASDGAEVRVSGGRAYSGSLFYHDFYDAGSPDIVDVSFTGLFLNGNIENQLQPFYPKGTTDDGRIWQHGHGIAIYRGRGLRVTGCKIRGFWGNGVHVQTEPFPAYTDLKTIPQVSVDTKIMFNEFVDIFGIAVCGCNTQAMEIAYNYIHGDGYWVGAITPEVAYEEGVMMDWNIHHNLIDFRDGKLPIESVLALTSSTDPAGQQYRRRTRRALCAILAYNQYTNGKYNDHLRGIRFTDNVVYQGFVQIYNFADVDVSRNSFYGAYEDMTGVFLSGGAVIEIGSYSDTTGLHNARVADNTINWDIEGFGINVMRTDDIQVSGNLVKKCRWGGIRIATCSGTVSHNRIINVGMPVSDTEFAANPSLSPGCVVYGTYSRPLSFFHEEYIENRTGAARAMRHGLVVNAGLDPAKGIYARLCTSTGILGDTVKDTGGEGGGPVRAWGNTKDGDDTFRVNRGLAARNVETSGSIVSRVGLVRAPYLEATAPAGGKATVSFLTNDYLALQFHASEDGTFVAQKFDGTTTGKGAFQSNIWHVTAGGNLALGTDWRRPMLLNGTLRCWSVGGRVYTKPGADPTTETDGSLLIQRVAVPETATSPGIEGQSAWDASYHYLCTGANQWRRTPIATW
ncbi:hypothetical protein ASG37_04885 [Sphingomonas sp. Leaf407]|uniref:right-handed parallel beta-helix repeat-containing protein n=1 Tax=unclassified Sphingomonas TaxID=196159 RepID=UPI0007098058|nr:MULTISPECIES: right-handed parallel beta-helix repeat-containing protein [unclassified Sphingomonas]KQN37001.1 hypothetical protein ASE97_10800 [Sphingomonas sp. Leaf42]KQT30428.1 hypothetical protein ASG37_04885 [Sphingomonas sp. Leaf407]